MRGLPRSRPGLDDEMALIGKPFRWASHLRTALAVLEGDEDRESMPPGAKKSCRWGRCSSGAE